MRPEAGNGRPPRCAQGFRAICGSLRPCRGLTGANCAQTKPTFARAKPYIQPLVPYIDKAKPYAPPLAVAAVIVAAIPVILTLMFLALITSPVSHISCCCCRGLIYHTPL